MGNIYFIKLPHMADVDTKKDKEGVEKKDLKKTKITFSSNQLDRVQKVANQLVGNAKAQNVKIKGPVPMPNKHLTVTCRRTPCGEGSKTWDHWEMTIHKRLI